jgi:Ca2+ transporting ATPase
MCVFQKGVEDFDVIKSGVKQMQDTKGQQTKDAFSDIQEDVRYINNKNSIDGTSYATTASPQGKGILTANDLEFGMSLDELKQLMEMKGNELRDRINKDLGGVEGLANRLKTNVQTGIEGTKEEIQKRVKKFGRNEIPPKRAKTIFELAFEAVQDTTLIMLIVCSIISIGLSFYHPPEEQLDEEIVTESKDMGNLEWVEGAAIMIAVIVVVFVTAFNDWRKERQFRGLKDRIDQEHSASVIRNGKVVQANVKELVVGDLCCIKYGDLIPADGIVVQASDLKIDESSLTGETDLIKKKVGENMLLLSGTHVMEGSGLFIVTAVGLNSQTGIIMTLLGATDEDADTKYAQEKEKLESKKIEKTSKSSNEENKSKKDKKKKTKRHRSVLQIKLGKLALQIGYVGK